jgi:hypothetical protein
MPAKDRTAEFHSALNSIKSRTALPRKGGKKDESKQRLLGRDGSPSAGPSGGGGKEGKKSEFGRMAGGIARDINSTTLKLQKLAQCEWRVLRKGGIGAVAGAEMFGKSAVRRGQVQDLWRGGRAGRDRQRGPSGEIIVIRVDGDGLNWLVLFQSR